MTADPKDAGANGQPPEYGPTHPGEILREDVLPALGITKAELARALGISRRALYDLLDERGAVTPDMALRLERVCGSTAETWLGLYNRHALHRLRAKGDAPGTAVPAER